MHSSLPESRKAFIALGSNLGNRRASCMDAAGRLAGLEGMEVVRISSPYETEPVGIASKNLFINAVMEINTDLEPGRLLEVLLEIEQEMGRDRAAGPDRTIDLDILFVEDMIMDRACPGGRLVLPHPRIRERDFVLVPWAELAPELVVEPWGRTVRQMVEDLPAGNSVVRQVSWKAERIMP